MRIANYVFPLDPHQNQHSTFCTAGPGKPKHLLMKLSRAHFAITAAYYRKGDRRNPQVPLAYVSLRLDMDVFKEFAMWPCFSTYNKYWNNKTNNRYWSTLKTASYFNVSFCRLQSISEIHEAKYLPTGLYNNSLWEWGQSEDECRHGKQTCPLRFVNIQNSSEKAIFG